jgi:hypothetical protein
VIPDSGHVIIDSFAQMRVLTNAQIIADTLNKHHDIYEATLKIHGKKMLTGSGLYDLKTRKSGIQEIHFADIAVKQQDGEHIIVATGVIPESQQFVFDPMLSYYGTVYLESNRKKLSFDGFAHLNLKQAKARTDWWSFKDVVGMDTLLFHVKDPENTVGSPVLAGFFLNSNDTTGMYTSIMAPKLNSRDNPVFVADGIVRYDVESGRIEIGSEEKINGQAVTGNVLKYNDGTGDVYGEGIINPGFDFGAIDWKAAGNLHNNLNDSVFALNLVFSLNIELSDELMEAFANDMYAYNIDMPDVYYDSPEFIASISELIADEKESEKFIQDLRTTGLFLKPKALTHTILFSSLKLTYDRHSKTYVSQGPIGVSFIGDKAIHKMLKGYVEFGFRRSSDYFNIYFETDLNDWYFLSYSSSTLQILTSNQELNQMIVDLDPEKRRVKNDEGKYYIYSISTQTKMKSFVNRMKGIDDGSDE